LKILLADDDLISRRLMERMLQSSGYEVVTAKNGREAAAELSRSDGARLALLDWMMPELDGLGVCHEIRDRHDESYVYILLLTSRESHEDIVAGLKAGADDYLTKPCHPAELKARLQAGRRILMLEDKLVEAREAMRFKATHDALTTLLDRGAILAQLQNELKHYEARQDSTSILLCDIDHFKQINDVYGHLVGDEVIRQVSKRLVNAVRPDDAVGRYGGEEFLIILQGCGRDGLAGRAEQVREAVGAAPFTTQAGPLRISISVGAMTVDGWNGAVPVESLLKHADEALYRAKAAGRNCVVYAEAVTPLCILAPTVSYPAENIHLAQTSHNSDAAVL
jgi:two-component system, cell cycle response regulator